MTSGSCPHILSLLIEDRQDFDYLLASMGLLTVFLIHRYVRTCVISGYIDWTLLPRQRILKRITQVEQAPCNDDIVVKSHVKTDLEKKGFMNDLPNELSIFALQALEIYGRQQNVPTCILYIL